MILRTFDNGWGTEFPVKQFEQEIVKSLLNKLSDSSIVLINSTWYSNDDHQQVLAYLRQTPVDYIVLVSMLDPAIVKPDWFHEFSHKVIGLGYYTGLGEIDFWALVLDRYFETPPLIDLVRVDRIDCAYMCLNRKPHWHRLEFYQQLEQLKLLDYGLVSLGSNNGIAVRSVEPDIPVPNLTPNSGTEQNGIANDICSLGSVKSWQRCFLNIVTETVYSINQHYFVSEKIYKPILGMRPFLVYDVDGAHKWLSSRGFLTYQNDFQDISDLDLLNPINIAPFLGVLCGQPNSYFQHKLVDLNQKIMYNRTQFYKYVNDQKLIIQKGIVCPT